MVVIAARGLAVLSALAAAGAFVAHAVAAPADGFVKWTEPKEKAFSLEVPKGWTIRGGVTRPGKTDTRQYVQAESPQKDAMIQLGDPSLPQFCTLGSLDQQFGFHEGQARNVLGNFTQVYMHFMPATEFNRLYIEKGLSSVIKNIQVDGEQDMPQVAQQMTAQAAKNAPAGIRPLYSVGMTQFKGISRETGKPVAGAVMTMTQLTNANSGEYGSIWTAMPIIVGGVSDQNEQQRVKFVVTAAAHMMQTRRMDPVWNQKEQARESKVTQEAVARNKRETQIAIARIQDAGARSRAMSRSSDDARQASMNSYWRRNAARAENQHQFINYIRDERDATDRNGNALYDGNGDHLTVPDR